MSLKSQRYYDMLAFKYAAAEMRIQDFENFFADEMHAANPVDQEELNVRLEKAQARVVEYLERKCK